MYLCGRSEFMVVKGHKDAPTTRSSKVLGRALFKADYTHLADLLESRRHSPKIDLVKLLTGAIKDCLSLQAAPRSLLLSTIGTSGEELSPLEAISSQLTVSTTKDPSLQPLSLQELALSAVTLELVRLWSIDSQISTCIVDDLNRSKGTAWLSTTCARLSKTLKSFPNSSEEQLLAFAQIVQSETPEEQQSLLCSALEKMAVVILHPQCDGRLIDRNASACFAGAFLCIRRDVKGRDEIVNLVHKLRDELPRRCAAQALINVASGIFVVPSERFGTGALQTVPWLRVAAAAELGWLSMRPGGIEGILDAVFDGVDLNNPTAVDRARLQIAGILARPPLEQCLPRDYFSAAGVQILPLLRIRGKNAHLLSSTSALIVAGFLGFINDDDIIQLDRGALASSLSSSSSSWGEAVWFCILQPLVSPLLSYASGESKRSEPTILTDLGRVEIMKDDDVMGCVEDLLLVVQSSLPKPNTAIFLLSLVASALLDLMTRASLSRLRTGIATACKELLSTLFSVAPVDRSVAFLQTIAGQSMSITSIALSRSLRLRHPCVAIGLSDSAGFCLNLFSYPVHADGRPVDSTGVGPLLGLSPSISSGKKVREMNKRSTLSSLINIREESNAFSSYSIDKAGDPRAHSEGLGGVLHGWQLESSRTANAIVDVLVDIGSKDKASEIAGSLFSDLLQHYTKTRLSPREVETDDEQQVNVRSLQLLITVAERLGPSALRTSNHSIQTVRSVLALAVASIGLPEIDARIVGCSERATEIHELQKSSSSASNSASHLIKGVSENEDVDELISTCLGLLTVLLSPSDEEESDSLERFHWFKSYLPLLASLGSHSDAHISEMSTALRAMLVMMTEPIRERAEPSTKTIPSSVPSSSKLTNQMIESTSLNERIQSSLQLVMDPAPALQAHGIRQLAYIIKAAPPDLYSTTSGIGSTKRLSPQAVAILDVAVRQLETTDSYVFLASIECLRSFASVFPADALPRLLRLYSGDATAEGGSFQLTLRARVKLGEVLALAAQSAGRAGVLPAYASALIGTLSKVGIAGWRRQEELDSSLLQTRTAADDDSSSNLDERIAYNIAVELTDLADLRASALACLGEVSAFLGPALTDRASDVLGGLCGILSMERKPKGIYREGVDEEAVSVAVEAGARVRRAAALALCRVVQGDPLSPRALLGGNDGLITSLGDNLRTTYSVIQTVAATPVREGPGDPDAIVRAHAKDALFVLDEAIQNLFGSSGRTASHQNGNGARLSYF